MDGPLRPARATGVGLCPGCVAGRRVESARGSVFWRCERSEHDPAFAKYPRLPVLRCPGYEAVEARPNPTPSTPTTTNPKGHGR